jgi:aminoglycoside 3-N-acetyltransferase
MKEEIDYLQIASYIGLKDDDVLFVGADLSRLAMRVAKKGERFDVNKFIDSFLEKLPNGTLIIPTYTDNLKSGMTFDVRKSKPNIGSLAVAAFKRKDAYRTTDPFHSMAVWGKHVPLFESITDKSTFGKKSAFGLLHQLKAKMLMIDVSLNQNFTFVHYCEESAKVPWRKFVTHIINIINYQGIEHTDLFEFYTRKMGFINALNPLEYAFEQEKIIKTIDFQGISLKLISLSYAYDKILQDIHDNHGRKIHKFCPFELIKNIVKKIIRRQ